MAKTKAQYRGLVRELAGAYELEIKLSQPQIDKAIQNSIDEVFTHIFPKRPHLWRKTAVLNHGAALPTDWLGYAGNAWITDGSGNKSPFRYAPIPMIPAVKKNHMELATATEPVLYFCERKMFTVPAAIQNVSIEYFSQPVQLYGASVTDATPSDIPQDFDGVVVRGALDRLFTMMVEEKVALELTEAEFESIQKSNMELYSNQLMMQLEGLDYR